MKTTEFSSFNIFFNIFTIFFFCSRWEEGKKSKKAIKTVVSSLLLIHLLTFKESSLNWILSFLNISVLKLADTTMVSFLERKKQCCNYLDLMFLPNECLPYSPRKLYSTHFTFMMCAVYFKTLHITPVPTPPHGLQDKEHSGTSQAITMLNLFFFRVFFLWDPFNFNQLSSSVIC